MSHISQKNFIKVILVGESNTGKTNIINRFCNNSFDERTQVTIGCLSFSKSLELSSNRIVNLYMRHIVV